MGGMFKQAGLTHKITCGSLCGYKLPCGTVEGARSRGACVRVCATLQGRRRRMQQDELNAVTKAPEKATSLHKHQHPNSVAKGKPQTAGTSRNGMPLHRSR